MSESTEKRKAGSTELTWKEKNPFSYRFSAEGVEKLEKIVEKVKNGESGQDEGGEH
jgi:hypothetical protein